MDGGAGLRPGGAAKAGPGGPQGNFRRGPDAGGERRLYRGRVARGGGGRPGRLRLGPSGGAGGHLAGGGSEVYLRHALPPGGGGRRAFPPGSGGHPGKTCPLRCAGPGAGPRAESGDGGAHPAAAIGDGEARGAGRRWHQRPGGAYRYPGRKAGTGHGADAPRGGVRPDRGPLRRKGPGGEGLRRGSRVLAGTQGAPEPHGHALGHGAGERHWELRHGQGRQRGCPHGAHRGAPGPGGQSHPGGGPGELAPRAGRGRRRIFSAACPWPSGS